MNTTWRIAVASALALSVTSAVAGNFAMATRTPASGTGALITTTPGSPVTLQDNNLRMEAKVLWGGPPNRGGLIVYNGHGCCSGWGILLLGEADGGDRHKLSVLAGGITVAVAQVTLPVGEWVRVAMERRDQVVTLIVGEDDAAQVYDLGVIPVNPLGTDRIIGGQPLRLTEKVTIGENFNGIVDDVKFRSLEGKGNSGVIEYWRFNQVTGFTATGQNGAVLTTLQNAAWIAVDDED